ncbi:hypothetical protein BCR36DRAFT_580691 [Piromyces finnis]|uniref:Uncharacterized protein n=1 Tax=Piromyces finnis TaxID=1754191 RepID=A0A1Y1VIP4_9FUNG|nr:hypothetical protein BCR36DRAFT_580691 [Piromyces finnis]|eukprot:ORX57277.1 hypothetical protein BCR36DRAFT_580691 [Piromyces finnis]
MNSKKCKSSSNIIFNDQLKHMDINSRLILQSGNSYNFRKLSSSNSRESLLSSKSEYSLILNNNDFSYRNEKKYYQLLEKHRLRQDKIKKLSTRTNILSNNEFGIKNAPNSTDRLPKITKSSYQALSGFCQRNCPLPSAKEIININFSDKYEKECRKKKRENKTYYNTLRKTVSYPVVKPKNINENINNEIKEIKELENSIIQKSLQNLVNCARRTGRGLFCGV